MRGYRRMVSTWRHLVSRFREPAEHVTVASQSDDVKFHVWPGKRNDGCFLQTIVISLSSKVNHTSNFRIVSAAFEDRATVDTVNRQTHLPHFCLSFLYLPRLMSTQRLRSIHFLLRSPSRHNGVTFGEYFSWRNCPITLV